MGEVSNMIGAQAKRHCARVAGAHQVLHKLGEIMEGVMSRENE
jgi:hypothetical protein